MTHPAGLGPQPLVDLPVAVGHEGQGQAFPLRGRRQSFVADHRRRPHELLERRIGLGRFGDGDAGVGSPAFSRDGQAEGRGAPLRGEVFDLEFLGVDFDAGGEFSDRSREAGIFNATVAECKGRAAGWRRNSNGWTSAVASACRWRCFGFPASTGRAATLSSTSTTVLPGG